MTPCDSMPLRSVSTRCSATAAASSAEQPLARRIASMIDRTASAGSETRSSDRVSLLGFGDDAGAPVPILLCMRTTASRPVCDLRRLGARPPVDKRLCQNRCINNSCIIHGSSDGDFAHPPAADGSPHLRGRGAAAELQGCRRRVACQRDDGQQQIRYLEREWGCLLFVRKTRQVILTDAGVRSPASSAAPSTTSAPRSKRISRPCGRP